MRLVRVASAVPAQRPDRSAGGPVGGGGYTLFQSDGDDGAPLSDYDIIGAAGAARAVLLFRGRRFNLCASAAYRERDVGLSICCRGAPVREPQALLLVDPPASWTSAPAALDGCACAVRSDSAVIITRACRRSIGSRPG